VDEEEEEYKNSLPLIDTTLDLSVWNPIVASSIYRNIHITLSLIFFFQFIVLLCRLLPTQGKRTAPRKETRRLSFFPLSFFLIGMPFLPPPLSQEYYSSLFFQEIYSDDDDDDMLD